MACGFIDRKRPTIERDSNKPIYQILLGEPHHGVRVDPSVREIYLATFDIGKIGWRWTRLLEQYLQNY
jgi:hypothetical protein